MTDAGIPDDFLGLKGLTLLPLGIPNQTDYNDEIYLSQVSLYKIDDLTDDQILDRWTKIVSSMANGTFSEKNLLQMLECALNLKGVAQNTKPLLTSRVPRENFAYLSDPAERPIPGGTAETSTMSVLAGQQSPSAQITEPPYSKARAVPYICCAFMRLAAKDADQIRKALPNLKRSYELLYRAQSSLLTSFSPPRTWADKVKNRLTAFPGITGTLSFHMAVSEKSMGVTHQNYRLCRMLLYQHLEMMGMHIYKMSVALMRHMDRITPALFLTWLRNRQSDKAISMIDMLMRTLDNENDENRTYYWKYARLVNPTFFLDLSTKRNQYLGGVLAKLTKEMNLGGTDEYANPESIAALTNSG